MIDLDAMENMEEEGFSSTNPTSVQDEPELTPGVVIDTEADVLSVDSEPTTNDDYAPDGAGFDDLDDVQPEDKEDEETESSVIGTVDLPVNGDLPASEMEVPETNHVNIADSGIQPYTPAALITRQNDSVGLTWNDQQRIREERQRIKEQELSSRSVLASAMVRKRIVSGTVTGVRSYKSQVGWVIYTPGADVFVPFEDALLIVADDLKAADGNYTKEQLKRQAQIMTANVGAIVEFIPISVEQDKNGRIVYRASRLMALGKIREIYFGPKATAQPMVGSETVARIISLSTSIAYITCFGFDFRIHRDNMTFRYIESCTDCFSVGQEILVRVMEVNPYDGKNPPVRVSPKAPEIAKNKLRSNTIHPLDRVRAIVTGSYTKKDAATGETRMVVFLDLVNQELAGFTSVFFVPLEEPLRRGDEVIFEAHGVNKDGFVYGMIVRVLHTYKHR